MMKVLVTVFPSASVLTLSSVVDVVVVVESPIDSVEDVDVLST